MELKDFVSLDIETTGLNPKEDTITEIAAVRTQNGKPWTPVYYWQLGMTDPHTRDIRTREIHLHFGPSNNPYEFLKEYVGDVPIIGYRVDFDIRFLNIELAKHGVMLDNPFFCVYKLAKRFLNLPDFKLETVASYFDEKAEHAAFADAIATANVFQKMIPMLNALKIHSFEDIGKLEQGRLRRI